jgi:hypothetical protein
VADMMPLPIKITSGSRTWFSLFMEKYASAN